MSNSKSEEHRCEECNSVCQNCNTAPEPPQDTSLDDRPRAVQNGMSQAEYDTWMFLSDKEALDKPYTYAVSSSDLAKLLAKQQAKLLQVIEGEAEVYNIKSRNGEIVEPNTGVMAVPLEVIKQIKERYE